jgi:IS5 family transposase
LGFTDYQHTYAKKKTHRQIFLEEMKNHDSVGILYGPDTAGVLKAQGRGWRPPFPLAVLLRIHPLQQ